MSFDIFSECFSQTPRFFQTPRILSGIWFRFQKIEALIWAGSGEISVLIMHVLEKFTPLAKNYIATGSTGSDKSHFRHAYTDSEYNISIPSVSSVKNRHGVLNPPPSIGRCVG